MKKVIPVTFIICMLASTVFAQNSSLNNYKKFDYVRVDEGSMDQFLKLAEQELKPRFQELTDSDVLSSWSLYYVRFPGGEKSNYHLISIATATNIDTLLNTFSDLRLPSYIPANTSEKIQKLASTSTLVKSELWKVENALPINGNADLPSTYMTMDYMEVAPGKNPDYLMLEDEVAKPIHQERMDKNAMAGWHVYSLISPSGSSYGYNFSTANFFNQASDIEFGFTNEVINQSMGKNANVSELFNTIYTTRDRVKVELWKLYLHVN
jgi:hypothetical protein